MAACAGLGEAGDEILVGCRAVRSLRSGLRSSGLIQNTFKTLKGFQQECKVGCGCRIPEFKVIQAVQTQSYLLDLLAYLKRMV